VCPETSREPDEGGCDHHARQQQTIDPVLDCVENDEDEHEGQAEEQHRAEQRVPKTHRERLAQPNHANDRTRTVGAAVSSARAAARA
jgi:hypothetical protein